MTHLGMHCNALQHAATRCNTLGQVAGVLMLPMEPDDSFGRIRRQDDDGDRSQCVAACHSLS